jgi:IS4 transposase
MIHPATIPARRRIDAPCLPLTLIRLSGPRSARNYPALWRRVTYYDPDTFRLFTYLTNHLEVAALVIALLYKSRWRGELFFKVRREVAHVTV